MEDIKTRILNRIDKEDDGGIDCIKRAVTHEMAKDPAYKYDPDCPFIYETDYNYLFEYAILARRATR